MPPTAPTPAESPKRPWLGLAAVGVALVALVAAVYAPVRHHEYLDLDDLPLIVWNPDMEPASLGEALAIAFGKPQVSGWVPVTTLSHQLDRWLWGRDAGMPLLENVALHALATLLLLLAFERLTGRLGASAFVAGVFAVHPLHVESVAWAIERKDVLSAACFAALLLLYARFAERPDSDARWRAVLACLALGLLCKPMLVTAPFVLLLLDGWPLRRLDADALREKLPMFGMALIVAVVTWRAQQGVGALSFGEALPLGARVENALHALVAYLGDAVWPSGLAPYYPHPGRSLGAARVAAAALALAALTAGALALRRRMPWLLVGWLWYAGMLVPVLGLVQVGMQARADRYTYLPLVGISLALAFTVDALARSAAARRTAAGAGALAIVALAAAAAPQVHVWRDSRSLYERMRSAHPDAAYPELRLGMVEAIDGHLERARPHLERAYALDPALGRDAVRQLIGLAHDRALQGEPDVALRTARFALGFAEQTAQPERARELRARIAELERALHR